MIPDPKPLIEKALSIWESDPKRAESLLRGIHKHCAGTPDGDAAQAYLFNLRNGEARPEPTGLKPGDGIPPRPPGQVYRTVYLVMATIFLVVIMLLLPGLLQFTVDISMGKVPFPPTAIGTLALLMLPALWLGPRLYRRFRYKTPLLPDDYAITRPKGLYVGMFFVWFGFVGIAISAAVLVIALVTQARGVPVGLGIGLSMFPLALGIIIVESSFARWHRDVRAADSAPGQSETDNPESNVCS